MLLVASAFPLPALAAAQPRGAGEAERWEAFRRYLTDFPGSQEAPPASLELWERYLVYGIAFGIAERVLQAAHLQMPEELHEQSSIYWICPTGDLGSGRARSRSATSPPASAPRSPRRIGLGRRGGGFSGGGGGAAAAAEAGPGRRPRAVRALPSPAPAKVLRGRAAHGFVERDVSGRRDVQRVGMPGLRNRRDRLAAAQHVVGQTLALRTEHERHRVAELELRQRRASVRDERDARWA